MTDNDYLYRPCAGVVLLNAKGEVFTARRIDNRADAWQMPQGGIDDGEDSWTAAIRELEEETGITPDLVTRVEGSPVLSLRYDLPDELKGKLWGGRYVGQKQDWYLLRFDGEDADIDIETATPEFSHWRWADPLTLPDMIVPFKKKLYEDIVAGFADWFTPR